TNFCGGVSGGGRSRGGEPPKNLVTPSSCAEKTSRMVLAIMGRRSTLENAYRAECGRGQRSDPPHVVVRRRGRWTRRSAVPQTTLVREGRLSAGYRIDPLYRHNPIHGCLSSGWWGGTSQ